MHLTLTQISTSDPHYPMVERLMLSAFPVDERRDTPQQRLYTDTNAKFVCSVIEDDGRAVGLINYWMFDGCCYVEHFAVDPSLRGAGYGSAALTALKDKVSVPIVLEVELPTDDVSRRRIAFYRRNGFRLLDDVHYVQPPYRQGGNEVHMHLMASSDIDSAAVTATLRREVYGIGG